MQVHQGGQRYAVRLAVKKMRKIGLSLFLFSSFVIVTDEQFLKTRACSGQILLRRRKPCGAIIGIVLFVLFVAKGISESGQTG